MADARTATLIRLTGGRRPRQLPHKRWAVAYGLACQLFPLYLVGTGLLIMGGVFSGMGTIGALLLLMLLGMLATQGYKLVVRNVREVRAAGGSLLRLAGLAAAGVAAVAVLLTQVTVELQASAGYARVDGRPVLVLPPGTHSASIPIGATVVLRSQGFLAGRTLGRTTVAPGAPRRARVSLTAISPLHTGIRVPATVRPLNGDPVLPVDAGSARVNLGRSSLALRLYHEYLASALNLPS
jgi:putative peptide zinc metalloprotease protein